MSYTSVNQLSAASAIFEELYLVKASVKFSEDAMAELIKIQVLPASCTSLEG